MNIINLYYIDFIENSLILFHILIIKIIFYFIEMFKINNIIFFIFNRIYINILNSSNIPFGNICYPT